MKDKENKKGAASGLYIVRESYNSVDRWCIFPDI